MLEFEKDYKLVSEQFGRVPRGFVKVVARSPKTSSPWVVLTAPWVEGKKGNLEPFPTVYYLSSPEISSKLSTLEANGLMKEYESILKESSELKSLYLKAHLAYIKDRAALAKELNLPEIVPSHSDFSAGGMPFRVKCLHALVAHHLAFSQGYASFNNPFGELAWKEAIKRWPELSD